MAKVFPHQIVNFLNNYSKKGNHEEYYRWNKQHKDIEIYDSKAREVGSKDPVTGKIYRPGDMKVNDKLNSIIK